MPSPVPAPEGTDKTDCEWGDWTEWEKCTKTCGGGLRAKTRKKATEASDGGKECVGSPEVTQPCNVLDCPVDCKWTEWEDWSKCSKECDFGERSRTRAVSKEAAFGGSNCSGNATETKACNSFICPVDCEWGGWGGWTDCSRTCAGGRRTRERVVVTEAAGAGKKCKGEATQRQACNEVPCPVDCAWDDWGGWEKCSKPCNNGTASRKRTVKVAAAHEGKLCEGPDGEDKVCNPQPCPVPCEWTDWSSWGSCTATCGGATRARNRTRRVEAQFGGAPCMGADGQTQPCQTPPCPVDCSWQDWGPWQSCICGAGVKYRTREMDLESNGGQSCPDKDTGGMEKTVCDPGEACVSAVKAVDYGNGTKPETAPGGAAWPAANNGTTMSSKPVPGDGTTPNTNESGEKVVVPSSSGNWTKLDVANGTGPDAANGTKPGADKGTEPDAANGTRPGADKETEPDAANGARPGADKGTEPDAANGTRPSADKGTEQDASNGTRPSADNGTEQDAANGTTITSNSVPGPLNAANGTKPDTNNSVEKISIPSSGKLPTLDAANESKPDVANGTKPDADDGTKADAAKGIMPEKWTVSIDKDVGQSLGIEYNVTENGTETGTDLPILKIGGSGLLADWNSKNPGREVREGDVIVEVNGKKSASGMADELGMIKKLDIVIFRPGSKTSSDTRGSLNGTAEASSDDSNATKEFGAHDSVVGASSASGTVGANSSGTSSSDTSTSDNPTSAPTSAPSAAGGSDSPPSGIPNASSAAPGGSNAGVVAPNGTEEAVGSGASKSGFSGQVVGSILLTVGQGMGATFAGKSTAATAMREAVAALAGVPPALVKANLTVLPNGSLAVEFAVEMSQVSGVSYANEESFAQALAKKDVSSVQEEVNLALAKHDLEYAVQVQAIQAEAKTTAVNSGAAPACAWFAALLAAAAAAALSAG